MKNTTDHPGEEWVAVGPDCYVREFIAGVFGSVYAAHAGWSGGCGLVLAGQNCPVGVTITAPTAALAAQRVAVLADEVREDVRRLAQAWGCLRIADVDWAKAPAPAVDREAACKAIEEALWNTCDLGDPGPHTLDGQAAVLDAVLSCITPTPTAKEATP